MLRAASYGLLLGAGIALLEFVYYRPLVPAPLGVLSFAAALLTWCGEGAILALTVALFERRQAPRPLGAWRLAAAVAAGALLAVVAWQAFIQLVLRARFGIPVFLDYVGQPVHWSGTVIYHAWMVLLFGGLATALHASRERHARMLNALRSAELARENSQRVLAEARLAAVRARVDPAWLYQTLTELERLYEAEPREAGRRLDGLISHLRQHVSSQDECKEEA